MIDPVCANMESATIFKDRSNVSAIRALCSQQIVILVLILMNVIDRQQYVTMELASIQWGHTNVNVMMDLKLARMGIVSVRILHIIKIL